MALAVRIVTAAARDLESIHEYTVDQFGPSQAARYIDGLREAFERLALFPRIGVEAKPGSGVRVWHYQRHRIVYRVAAEAVEVSRVLHAARDVDLVLEHYAALRTGRGEGP